MREKSNSEIGGFDWLTAGIALTLIMTGWVMIFASEYQTDSGDQLPSFFNMSKNYGKQFLFICAAVVLTAASQLLEIKFYRAIAPIFYGVSLVLLIAVLGTKPVNGATSWFSIGSFRLQPSEIAKVSTCLLLASFLSLPENKFTNIKAKAQALGIALLPMGLVLLQGDAGSTFVFVAFLLVIMRAGMDLWIYILGTLLGILSIAALMVDSTEGLFLLLVLIGNGVLIHFGQKDRRLLLAYAAVGFLSYNFLNDINYWYIMASHGVLLSGLLIFNLRKNWQLSVATFGGIIVSGLYISSINYLFYKVLKDYQQERILVWLRPEKCDPLGALYNVDQSKYAIGSGALLGKGFLNGERTKLDYVPEQSTDFIFCTIGEEWGFFGTTFVLLLFLFLLLRIVHLAERQRSLFAKYYAYGVACILFFHIFVNVGMTIGVVPVIGIPLPFFSYGGSSLLSFTLLIALLLKFDSQRLMVFR